MKKINLDAPAFTQAFALAKIFAKTTTVHATQITVAGLLNSNYLDRDVRYDPEVEDFIVETWVMQETRLPNGAGVRTPFLENVRKVKPGEWLVTNPKVWDSDRSNNYIIDDTTFRARYIPTPEEGVYRAQGLARIIENSTGEKVEINAPWGGTQAGDENCFFCAPYNPAHPNDLALHERYILSANDAAAYDLAENVLGPDWNK